MEYSKRGKMRSTGNKGKCIFVSPGLRNTAVLGISLRLLRTPVRAYWEGEEVQKTSMSSPSPILNGLTYSEKKSLAGLIAVSACTCIRLTRQL